MKIFSADIEHSHTHTYIHTHTHTHTHTHADTHIHKHTQWEVINYKSPKVCTFRICMQ